MRTSLVVAAAAALAGVVSAGPVLVTTSPGVTTYLSACGFYPPVDAGITVTGGPTVASAAVRFTAGFVPTDTLAVNPDPLAECTYGPADLSATTPLDCPPCPGLTVAGAGTPALTITGPGTVAAFQSCLRRVIFRSTAFGGEEGIGPRTVEFSATSTDAGAVPSVATKGIEELPVDESGCSALLLSTSLSLMSGAVEGEYPLPYSTACNGGPCNFVLIAPRATVTTALGGDSPSAVGSALVWFDLFTRVGPVTYFPAEDRVGFLPPPGGSPADPCAGLRVRVITSRDPNLPSDAPADVPSVFRGVQIFGPATAATYTTCLRRAYYSNIAAPPGTGTAGSRPSAVRVGSVPTAYSSGFAGVTLPVLVATPGVGAVCPRTGCGGPAPDPVVIFGGGPGVTPAPTSSPTGTGGGGGGGGTVLPSPSSSSAALPPGASPSASPGPFLPSGTHARIDWFASHDCSLPADAPSTVTAGGARSVVLVQQSVCNVVPDSGLAYVVRCDRDATGALTGSSSISFCESGCGFCSSTVRLTAGQCATNAPGSGARSFTVSCGAGGASGDISIGALRPGMNEAYARWVGASDCANEIAGASHLLVAQGTCQFVPSASGAVAAAVRGMSGGGSSSATAGRSYRLTCDLAGESGLFEVCDAGCSSCSVRTPFTPDASRGDGLSACLPNPAASGAMSVRFACGQSTVGLTSGVEALMVNALGGVAAAAAAVGVAAAGAHGL